MTILIIFALGLISASLFLIWKMRSSSTLFSRGKAAEEQAPISAHTHDADKKKTVVPESFDVRIRSQDPQIEFVMLKIGIAEMRIWIQLQNNCHEAVTVESVTWTFWFGKLVKSGKFSQGIHLEPGAGVDDYMVQEVMSEEELREIVRLKTDQHPNFYMEGDIYCSARKISFQRKFAGFNLRYQLVGYSETTKSPAFNVQTHLDTMTGLLQKRFLEEHLQIMIDTTVYRRPLSFIMADVDDFKKVNDTLGHLVGDDVIKAVCSQMKDVLGDRGLAIRFGGDEFGIVLEGFDSDEAKLLAGKIQEAVNNYKFVLPGKGLPDLKITLSIGVATLWKPAEYKVLIDKADKMLYESKRKGKNQVSVDPL